MSTHSRHLGDITREHPIVNDATAELRAVLYEGLRASNHPQKARPRVSSAGKCPRAITFALRGDEPSDPLSDDSLMNFLIGRAVEESWAKILVAAGAEILREETITLTHDGVTISGHKDFEAGLLLRNGRIIELKSINSRAMGWMIKREEEGRDEHRRQLNLYLHARGDEAGYLVYLVKDATRGEPILHAYLVRHDAVQAEADMGAIATAAKLAAAGELAPIPEGYKQSTYPCTYCNYKTACWLAASIESKSKAQN